MGEEEGGRDETRKGVGRGREREKRRENVKVSERRGRRVCGKRNKLE